MNPRRRDTCGNQTDPVPRFLTSFSSVIPSPCFNDSRNRHHGMTQSPRSVASPRVVSIADFRALARRRVPRAVFDYLDGGPEGEFTLRENCPVYEDVTFRPRHPVAVPYSTLCTPVLTS